jgi:hypothetical protein
MRAPAKLFLSGAGAYLAARWVARRRVGHACPAGAAPKKAGLRGALKRLLPRFPRRKPDEESLATRLLVSGLSRNSGQRDKRR